MAKRVSETMYCRYQIVQTERLTCEWPRTQPIRCLGEHDGHGLSDTGGDGTCGPDCGLDARPCC